MPIKPKIGKWYWIEDPGSNMHRGYTGPAKCLTDKKEEIYCGGPTYEFEFFDKDGGEKGEGGYETAGWGDEDIIRECDGPNSLGTVNLDELQALVETLSGRVKNLEQQVKQMKQLMEQDEGHE